jgi:hypothetical protein
VGSSGGLTPTQALRERFLIAGRLTGMESKLVNVLGLICVMHERRRSTILFRLIKAVVLPFCGGGTLGMDTGAYRCRPSPNDV